MALSPISLDDLRVSRHEIPAHGLIPNTAIQNRPLLIYHGAFADAPSADRIEAHLQAVGVASPQWRYTMYPTTHFHSTTHEVLCVSDGRARLCFGGEENDGRVEVVVRAGDVMIVPAGVAHRLLEDLDGRFQMVGAYPSGSHSWDMCYGRLGEETKIQGIENLEWFSRDPIYGERGPAVEPTSGPVD